MLAYVGCRTTRERNARGRGIGVFDATSGDWKLVQLVEGFENPSYLCLDRAGARLYSVHGDGDSVSAFDVEGATGRLTHLNSRPSGGRNPVHLAIDPEGGFLRVANLASGTIGTLAIAADGSRGVLADLRQIAGEPGPHRTQQLGPHPHQIVHDPSGVYVLAPDKGLDRINVFRRDSGSGALLDHSPGPSKSRAGAAPRHMVFHPAAPFAYAINELGSSVAAYRWDQDLGTLACLQMLPSIPAGHVGDNTGSGIAISADGRFLYVSNRGHDSIGVFGIGDGDGLLTPSQWKGTAGRQPRSFALDPSGDALHACNENSDTIVSFAVDRHTGVLGDILRTLRFESPTCVAFRPAPER
jgi:6-phosphogluconolactonase (cycloisomerase 2 family)